MEQWLQTQCNIYSNTFGSACRTLSMRLSGDAGECLVEKVPSTKIVQQDSGKSGLRKSFSFKDKAKRGEKVEPLLPSVLNTYNKSLFKETVS